MLVLLKSLLLLSGAAIIWLGLNVGLGGIETLGWQGAGDFVQVTDPGTFAVQDNHTRFIAGVWTCVGVLFVAGAFALQRLRTVLIVLIGMIFVGGLMRLTQSDMALLMSRDIAPSLVAELVLFPLLGLWIARATRGAEHV
ncbi:DUF4345 family protein [uncultured Tateyamaria sp.]|uniref:DUF4345 family protein n=1 Tax=uncultured Tateyamaria sp. TaxID=455651 RepID=UPI00260D615A|nr:DUF4345 family protein [uncultured Tateyamaria sp.]